MMMKKISYVLILTLFCSFALGELQQFITDFEIEVNNESITIDVEDSTYEFSNNCDTTSINSYRRSYNIVRECSCKTDVLIKQYQSHINVLSACVNDSVKYYDKYLDCYSSEKLCQQQLSTTNSSEHTDYLDKWTQCNDDFGNCKAEKSSLVTARQGAESKLSTCEEEKKSIADSRVIIGVICLALGAGGYYFIFDKGKRKPAISSAEQQLPKSR